MDGAATSLRSRRGPSPSPLGRFQTVHQPSLADDARRLRLVREAQDVGRVALVVGDDEVPVARVDRDRRGVDLELVDALREVLLEVARSEEHTSELQSLAYLVCRLLLEKKKSETQEQRISPS